VSTKFDQIIQTARQFINNNQFSAAYVELSGLSNKFKSKLDYLEVRSFCCVQLGHYTQAVSLLEKQVELKPKVLDYQRNLAAAYILLKDYVKAKKSYEKLQKKFPEDEDLLLNLSVAYIGVKQYTKAIKQISALLALNSEHALAYYNQAIAYTELKDESNAIIAFEKSIEIDSDNILVYTSYVVALKKFKHFIQALKWARKAIEVDPNDSESHFLIISLAGRLCALDETLLAYDHIYALHVDISRSNYLFTLNYSEKLIRSEIYQAHVKWGAKIESELTAVASKQFIDKENKIRIGYVSSDFKLHSVLFFIEPIIEQHDRNKFEIYCYANVKNEDSFSNRVKSKSDYWRNIHSLSQDECVKRIVEDKIDILIDLNGHTRHNRIELFVQKPAPIQVSYLGYVNTTGLTRMDYRMTDAYAETSDSEQYHTEKIIKLPSSFLCYRPPNDMAISVTKELPAKKQGYLTFASFNNIYKLNEEIIACWSKVLLACQSSNRGSKLILKDSLFVDIEVQNYYNNLFAKHGVNAGQVEYRGRIDSIEAHLELYNSVDICLDTYPYNGTTTTCEALWMGVPVLTLVGEKHASRVGYSIMSNVGLEEWVAHTTSEYIDKAVLFSADLDALAALKLSLRSKLLSSPLCDAAAVTKNIEAAFFNMVKEYAYEE